MKLASILENIEYNDSKPSISVLFESDNTKEIRILMRAGQLMKKHKTAFPIVVEIFEGNIEFGVNQSIMNLNRGDLIALEGSVPHDLKAIKDSIIRLTLTKKDLVDRVKSVVD